MPIQGARAISSLTRWGNPKKKIGVVMHPCEIRATIELMKLKQVNLQNIILITYDCEGVLPYSDYFRNPEEGEKKFEQVLRGEGNYTRYVCRICDKFSLNAADLHIGMTEKEILLIPTSAKGEEFIEGLEEGKNFSMWEEKITGIMKKRRTEKEIFFENFEKEISGIENLSKIFSKCINCHNCMRVCPICYCRQCYFDSNALKMDPENYIARAERKGALRFPTDTILFHLGRMSHMVLSCVGCGICEDSCPMDIPIARIFIFVAEKAQSVFDYVPGRKAEEPLPLVSYRDEEFNWVEVPYTKTYSRLEE